MSASFPFAANGRAMMTLQATDGFVRVVARRDNHLIVGWQAVGRGVSELAAAFSQSLEMGARLEGRRHDPCAPDARRSAAGGRAACARARGAYLTRITRNTKPPMRDVRLGGFSFAVPARPVAGRRRVLPGHFERGAQDPRAGADRGRAAVDQEIAQELGFSDMSSFSQAYKRWTGVAPSVSRQAAGL